jgi:WD40 repeat protein
MGNISQVVVQMARHTFMMYRRNFNLVSFLDITSEILIDLWFSVLQKLLAKDESIRAVCFSPDGKYLATGARDGTLYASPFSVQGHLMLISLQIWEINRKYVRNAFKGHTSHIMSLDFSPNGRSLVSTLGDNTVRLWNMHDGATKLMIDENIIFLNMPCYLSAVFSLDGTYVAACHSDGMVRIWDVCTGQLTRTIKAHLHCASCVVFTSDGKGLVSAGWDYKLRYWDVSYLDFIRSREKSRMLKNSHRENPGIVKTWEPEWEFLGDEVRCLPM